MNIANSSRARLDLIFEVGTRALNELKGATKRLDGKMEDLLGRKYQAEIGRYTPLPLQYLMWIIKIRTHQNTESMDWNLDHYSSKGLVEIIRHAIEARQKLVYELKLVDDKLVIDAVCASHLIVVQAKAEAERIEFARCRTCERCEVRRRSRSRRPARERLSSTSTLDNSPVSIDRYYSYITVLLITISMCAGSDLHSVIETLFELIKYIV